MTIVVALFSLMVGTPGVGAQEGTPIAGSDVPSPADCTVAPRPAEELRALFHEAEARASAASPEASPATAPPPGDPTDEQTLAAINATWRQYIACVNAGDQARMFALLSDKMVRRQFVVDIAFGVTEEALFAYLAATPVPLEPDQGAEFIPATDARVLGDGRVAVVGPGDAGRGDVRVFIKEGNRWLLDDWFDLA